MHENVYDQFVEVFVNEVKAINVGLPLEEKTAMGPMASLQQLEKVEYYIATAREQGQDCMRRIKTFNTSIG